MLPMPRCQASTICAWVDPCFSAREVMAAAVSRTGSSLLAMYAASRYQLASTTQRERKA